MPGLVPVGLAAALLVLAVPSLRQLRQQGSEHSLPSAPPTFDLGAPTRGSSIRLEYRATLPHQLLLIDYPAQILDSSPVGGVMRAELRESLSGDLVWSTQEDWAAIWSPDAGVLSLLVPSEQLRTAPHRLSIEWGPQDLPSTVFEIDFVRRP